MADPTPTTEPAPTEASAPPVGEMLAKATAPAAEPAPEPKSLGEELYPDPPSSEAPTAEPVKEPEAKPAESEPEAKPESEPAPAPLTLESYTDLKVPDTITVSEPILNEFKALALETGMTPEAAQKAVEFYARASTEAAKAQTQAWEATRAQWTADINAMPEFQGDRAARSAAVLGAAIEEFGDPSVREFFAATGDHPGVVKLILNMASALVEDGPMPQGGPAISGGKKSLGQILYPDSPN